jgi:hypothetical protein
MQSKPADPRKANDIEEACANGDGTYNAYETSPHICYPRFKPKAPCRLFCSA